MKKIKKYDSSSVFVYIVVIISILFVIIGTIRNNKNAEKVHKSHLFSIGTLESYTSSGAPESFSLTYSYRVGIKKHKRSIHAPYNRFPGCEHDFSICSDKEFWVAYEKRNPSNSLVNVYIEIQGVENPIPPETLDGFR